MSDITSASTIISAGRERPGSARTRRDVALAGAVSASAALSVAVAAFTEHRGAATLGSGVEWQLLLLLRFMAAVKTAMVLGACGLVHWRFGRAIAHPVALAYGASVAVMAAAPALIWSLSHVAIGAGLFHLGLLGFLVTAWRDDGVASALRSRR